MLVQADPPAVSPWTHARKPGRVVVNPPVDGSMPLSPRERRALACRRSMIWTGTPCIGLLWLLTPAMPHGPRGLLTQCRLCPTCAMTCAGGRGGLASIPPANRPSEVTPSFVSMRGVPPKGGKRWAWYSNMASLSCLVSPMADGQRGPQPGSAK